MSAPHPAGTALDPTPGTTGVVARLSVMMFLQFFVWGAYYVSMTSWMSEQRIGALGWWAYTVGPIAAVISPFFIGIIADRFFATQRVLSVLHLAGGAVMLAIPPVVAWANQPAETPEAAGFTHPFVLLLLLHMLCYMPTLGLSNSLAFRALRSAETQFPVVRVFGTIGWIVGNIVVGGSITISATITRGVSLAFTWIEEGTRSPAQFFIAGGAAILLGLYSLTLPHAPPPAAGRAISVREILGLDSLRLFARPGYAVFIAASLLLCIPLAAYYSNAYKFASTVITENTMLAMSSGQMSEIVFMLLMPLLFRSLGVKWMLAIGMLAWGVRYGLFATSASDGGAVPIIVGILLHGICYDFFFVTGFIYVNRVAPPELRSQAQGFLVLVTQGLGLGFGAFAVGKLVEHATSPALGLNWQQVWVVSALFAAVVMVLFVAFFHPPRADTGRE
ncbi:MAG: MFS transporter [Phycisphaerales bacterium]